MADIRDAQGVVIRKVPWYDKHRWGLYEGLLSFAVGIFIFAIVIFHGQTNLFSILTIPLNSKSLVHLVIL